MSAAARTASPALSAPARIGRHLAAHWRGDLPLPLSFWVDWAAVSTLLGAALGLQTIGIDVAGRDLRWGSIAVLIGWPATIAVSVWGAVGAWRSAGARAALGGPLPWPWAAKAGVVLGMAYALATTLASFAPGADDYGRLASGTDPIGHLDAVVSPDGRRLRLDGAVGMGDADRVEAVLQGNPNLALVEIRSPGGRLAEAAGIARLVRARPLRTRAAGRCDNACAIVLMAGRRRQLAPGAQLGFHRAPYATFNPLMRVAADRRQRAAYMRAGLPEAFVLRVLKTAPTTIWHPDPADLAAAGLVSVPDRPFDIDLPEAKDAPLAEYVEALRLNRAWQAIDRRFTGSIQSAAGQLQAARAQGADDAGTQLQAQRILEPLLQTLLVDAGPELRIRFIELLAQQLDAAHALGTDACRDVLAGGTAARAALPAALAWREAAWLRDAVDEPPPAAERRRSTALETEVVRRSLGDQAPALLARLRQPPPPNPRHAGCDGSAALIAAVLKLPVAERRLAARFAFQAGAAR